jgi:hypothetical protein
MSFQFFFLENKAQDRCARRAIAKKKTADCDRAQYIIQVFVWLAIISKKPFQ